MKLRGYVGIISHEFGEVNILNVLNLGNITIEHEHQKHVDYYVFKRH
jgi:hypothetical protein